jgi:hypothetical protein
VVDFYDNLYAHHEAGHAVAAFMCGLGIQRVQSRPAHSRLTTIDTPHTHFAAQVFLLGGWEGQRSCNGRTDELRKACDNDFREFIASVAKQHGLVAPESGTDVWVEELLRSETVFGATFQILDLYLLNLFSTSEHVDTAVTLLAKELLASEDAIEGRVAERLLSNHIAQHRGSAVPPAGYPPELT